MYELLATVVGIALYFLATRDSTTAAVAICGGMVGVGLVGFLVAGYLGRRRPKAAAVAPRFWSLSLIGVGAAVGWVVIAVSASIVESGKAHHATDTEVVVSALAAAAILIIAKAARVSERLGVKWAAILLLRTYAGKRLDSYAKESPLSDPVRLGYQALRDAKFNAGEEPVDGWGFRARRRRAELVAAGVAAVSPPAPPPAKPVKAPEGAQPSSGS